MASGAAWEVEDGDGEDDGEDEEDEDKDEDEAANRSDDTEDNNVATDRGKGSEGFDGRGEMDTGDGWGSSGSSRAVSGV